MANNLEPGLEVITASGGSVGLLTVRPTTCSAHLGCLTCIQRSHCCSNTPTNLVGCAQLAFDTTGTSKAAQYSGRLLHVTERQCPSCRACLSPTLLGAAALTSTTLTTTPLCRYPTWMHVQPRSCRSRSEAYPNLWRACAWGCWIA